MDRERPFADETPCCEKAGTFHDHAIDFSKLDEPPRILTPEEFAELEALLTSVQATSSETWVIRKEGRHSAAMGGPVAVFYEDPKIDVRPGAVVVGSGSDWGPTDVDKSALLVAGMYNALPRLLEEIKTLRKRVAELEAKNAARGDHP